MLVHSHAVTLVVLPIATVAVCIAFWRRPGAWRIAVAVVLGGLCAHVGRTFAGGWRVAGAPFAQWLVPAACVAALTLCVSRRLVAVAGVAVVGGALWFLLLSHMAIADSAHYTTDAAIYRFLDRWRGDVCRKTVRHLESVAAADAAYPEGWLVETVPAACDWWTLGAMRRRACHRTVVVPLWHTWLTGIHGLHLTRVDLWYPGGPLSTSARHIEWRDRP